MAARGLAGVSESLSDERSALMEMLKQLEEGLQLHREQQEKLVRFRVGSLCASVCFCGLVCVCVLVEIRGEMCLLMILALTHYFYMFR